MLFRLVPGLGNDLIKEKLSASRFYKGIQDLENVHVWCYNDIVIQKVYA